MLSITPCRTQISDRFPVASFVVRVPAEQSFEVACATDPDLFRPDRVDERTERNFFTTRFGGLLRAPAGEATIILPSEQLKNFAGSNRIYYTLGAYGGVGGKEGRFTLSPDRLDQLPYVQLAQDFTGRSLGRLGSPEPRAPSPEYGGRGRVLTWGGDLFAAAAANRQGYGDSRSYDDGYGSDLWRETDERTAGPPHARGTAAPGVDERWDGGNDGVASSSYWGTDPDAYESDEYDRWPAGGSGDSDDYAAEDYGGGEPEGSEHPDAVQAYAGAPGSEAPSYGFYGGGEPEGIEEPNQSFGGFDAQPRGSRGDLTEPEGIEEPEYAWGGGQDFFTEPGGHEPPGYEDVSELLGSGMQLESLPQEPAHLGDAPHTDAIGGYGNPDHESYSSVGYGSRAAAMPTPTRPAGILLSPREMTRIVRPTFKLNGGMDAYSDVSADGRGLVWGMVGFNQRDGSLREVLHAARRRDQQWYADTGQSVFDAVFGSQGSRDILTYMDRTEPAEWMDQVGGVQLRETSWVERFRKAGACHLPEVSGLTLQPERDPFKVAQNEIAITRHLVPVLPLARELGFNTDRSLAMLYDRIVDMGCDEATRWICESLGAVGPTGEVKGKLLHLVETAERQSRPWSHRLRAIHENTTDLYDTIYRLDEV